MDFAPCKSLDPGPAAIIDDRAAEKSFENFWQKSPAMHNGSERNQAAWAGKVAGKRGEPIR
jgi:hypothetical protein